MKKPLLAWVLLTIACTSARAGRTMRSPRLSLENRSHCRDQAGLPTQLAWLSQQKGLGEGRSTLTDLAVLRKTVVLVNDEYHDPHRIDPPRMVAKIVAAFAKFSDGALRAEGGRLVSSSGKSWAVPEVTSIWQVPLAVLDLGQFVLRNVPGTHRLARGTFAELLAANALLSTLDPQSLVMRGAPGSGSPAPKDVASEARAGIDESSRGNPPLEVLEDGIWKILLRRLSQETIEDVRASFAKAKPEGIVLDVRGNSGGTLEETAKTIDLFLSAGNLLVANGRNGATSEAAKDDGLPSERVKLIVLVDSSTACGGEIVSGTLRFSNRALLVGARTAGAGLILTVFTGRDRDSGDVTMLSLASAEAVLPGGRAFDGVGIAPDVEIGDPGPPPRLGCAPIGETVATVPARTGERDPALAFAVRALKASRGVDLADLLAAAKSVAATSP